MMTASSSTAAPSQDGSVAESNGGYTSAKKDEPGSFEALARKKELKLAKAAEAAKKKAERKAKKAAEGGAQPLQQQGPPPKFLKRNWVDVPNLEAQREGGTNMSILTWNVSHPGPRGCPDILLNQSRFVIDAGASVGQKRVIPWKRLSQGAGACCLVPSACQHD